MFRSFKQHSRIFRQNNLADYFMISSGTNQFSMPDIWKQSIVKEVESDFLYRWYTSGEGFQCITSAVRVYEDFASCDLHIGFPKSGRRICMTAGGSGAASHVFAYLSEKYHDCTVILVGMNYSLYERLARKHRFEVIELCSDRDCCAIPEPDCFRVPECRNKPVFVFSLPNNPTGKSYDMKAFSEIISVIKEQNGFVVMDCVCDIVISDAPHPLLRKVITQHNFWNNCAVVNSFSKSEAVAGLRIGYVYGSEELIRFCAEINASSIMNPPTFPAFPVLLTCMFRCLFINQRYYASCIVPDRIISFFRKLFFITSAVVPTNMLQYAKSIFDDAEILYASYVAEMLNNERIMKRNITHTVKAFCPYVQCVSEAEYSFNFCLWFRNALKMDEITLIRSLIAHTGIAILTQSSFTMRRTDQADYFIRFSTACNEQQYVCALERMKRYMEKEVFRL